MGKKVKAASPSKPDVVDEEVGRAGVGTPGLSGRSMPPRPRRARSPQTTKKIGELKAEAGKLFVGKDYSKAVDAYERAIKLLPDSAADKADLYSNKAACFYQQKR